MHPEDEGRLRRDWEDFVEAMSVPRETHRAGSVTFHIPSVTDGNVRYGGDVTFGSVQEYEASPCWRLARSTWHSRHPGARCFVCGRTYEIELHHLSYESLGYGPNWELLDQLVPVCTWHHYEIEKQIKAGAPRATAHLAFGDRRSTWPLYINS